MNIRLIRSQVSTLTVLGVLTCVTPLPALAQSSPTNDPLQDFQLEDSNSAEEVFTDRGGPGSLLNLLNRLQQVNSRSGSEFAEDQSANFDSAVDAFRKKQQEQLGSPTPSTPDSSGTGIETP
ncbi:hypothetical protein [Acaryochloris sp. CCMEE 5410]|uniref:hypothetical protein n=1 Tax=Acaryochloris sp. CCMEE 5410 TaxID=310037 RepID=UPI0002483B81|nr:hypothetical protein [Acaryochloris sp. CCMEE 5410]KAI9132404.1 hypothetical protein ON05_002785 [Acaryochloris sp. CCMEE 5410]